MENEKITLNLHAMKASFLNILIGMYEDPNVEDEEIIKEIAEASRFFKFVRENAEPCEDVKGRWRKLYERQS